MTWLGIAVLAAGTYAFRLAGPLLRARISVSDAAKQYLSLGAVALLSALIATATLTTGHGFAGWARPIAVLVGVVLAWRRLPFVVVVIGAAVTAAVLRLLGLP
jgi:branched-subunit amino acid transport protein